VDAVDQLYEVRVGEGMEGVLGEIEYLIFEGLIGGRVPQENLEVYSVQRGVFLKRYSLASTILYKTLSFMSRSYRLNLSCMILLIRRIDLRSLAKKWFFTPLSVLNYLQLYLPPKRAAITAHLLPN
jgi:hypothetical protein